jgi:hypothetical protein
MLKPQLGVWALAFYVLQVRRRLVAAAAFTAIPWVFLAVHFPVPTGDLIASYRQNVNFWFGVGKPFGFAAGAFPFNVNFAQIVLFQLWHSIVGVKVVAYAIFFLGLAVWLAAMLRSRFRAPLPLALSSLWGLSFVSLYHSVSDATILTLVLCWALPRAGRERSWPQRLALVLCCLMLLPGHSALIRMAAHLPIAIVDAWWWKLFVARYFVWLLLMFNAVLLFALWKPDCQSQVDEVLDADPKHCRTDDNSNRTESRAEVAAFAR